jgi:hypothetical protein
MIFEAIAAGVDGDFALDKLKVNRRSQAAAVFTQHDH